MYQIKRSSERVCVCMYTVIMSATTTVWPKSIKLTGVQCEKGLVHGGWQCLTVVGLFCGKHPPEGKKQKQKKPTTGSSFSCFYPVTTKLMYCHTWLMGSVAYQGPWSICERFNSNMENCMSEYQRVMSWALAFLAGLFLPGSYLPETLPYSDKITFTHYLKHIKFA